MFAFPKNTNDYLHRLTRQMNLKHRFCLSIWLDLIFRRFWNEQQQQLFWVLRSQPPPTSHIICAVVMHTCVCLFVMRTFPVCKPHFRECCTFTWGACRTKLMFLFNKTESQAFICCQDTRIEVMQGLQGLKNIWIMY